MSRPGEAKVAYAPGMDLSYVPCPTPSCDGLTTMIYIRCPCCGEEFIECDRCHAKWSREQLAEATK